MFAKHSFQQAKNSQSIAWHSAKLVSAAGISLIALRFGCAVVLICGFASLKLSAQASSNMQDATKTALVNEWNAPAGVGRVLTALQLLTSSSNAPNLNRNVLAALNAGDPNPYHQELYRAAMGDPDNDERPTVQGLPNFLDILAKANNLPKPIDESDLFDCSGPTFYCTQDLIDEISDTSGVPNTGPVAIARINESFSRKDNYVALYQLLSAYAATAADAGEANAVDYPARLQKLRAAFAISPDRLAKQVAAKIIAAKE